MCPESVIENLPGREQYYFQLTDSEHQYSMADVCWRHSYRKSVMYAWTAFIKENMIKIIYLNPTLSRY